MKNKAGCLMGRYELGRLIGQGSFARVYHARSVKTSQSVAIKVIDKEKVVTSGLTNQVKREISVMGVVRHPNVVHLYEVMATKTKIYFVMEYAKGGELFDKVAQGKLDEEIAQKYFRQLISVVDFCHSRGVYHRDLKPENILLDAYENLKVSDFGLSALVESRRRDGLLHTFCGTPAYVAPEVINQKGYEGDKADIWSCGVVLFVLLAGYLPFHHRNLVELYKRIGKAEYKFPKWFSHEVRLLLARILDPNPESRISIAKIRDNTWFKKEFNPRAKSTVVVCANGDPGPSGLSGSGAESDEESIKPAGLSAFDIISRSRIIDLSGLFGRGDRRKEDGFTSRQPVSVITSRLMEAAKQLRLGVKRIDEGRFSFKSPNAGKNGIVSIDLEVFRVAPTIHLIEIRKSSGDTMEYQRIMSQDIRPALQDIVWAWHKEKQQRE